MILKDDVITVHLPILAFFLLCGCNINPKDVYLIDDLSSTEKIVSKISIEENQYVDGVVINVKGFVNDTANLGQYTLLPLSIDTSFKHEWYSADYEILFDPYLADSGSVEISIEYIVY